MADDQINSDVYYSAKSEGSQGSLPIHESVPEQDQVPEGINTDVFHSPRVASLMRSGGEDDRRKAYEMKMKASRGPPKEQTPMTAGIDQESFNVRPGTVAEPQEQSGIAEGGHDEQETRKFAESLAADVTGASAASAEVRPILVMRVASLLLTYPFRCRRKPRSIPVRRTACESPECLRQDSVGYGNMAAWLRAWRSVP